MTHEFKELVLDGHNYPTWAMNVKISLVLCGLYEAILPLKRGLSHYLIHSSIMSYT
jgi:hypothetical protein